MWSNFRIMFFNVKLQRSLNMPLSAVHKDSVCEDSCPRQLNTAYCICYNCIASQYNPVSNKKWQCSSDKGPASDHSWFLIRLLQTVINEEKMLKMALSQLFSDMLQSLNSRWANIVYYRVQCLTVNILFSDLCYIVKISGYCTLPVSTWSIWRVARLYQIPSWNTTGCIQVSPVWEVWHLQAACCKWALCLFPV